MFTDTFETDNDFNSSAEITQMPSSSSSTQDPDDMTLEEYRQISGGALPPEYSLAAAAVGALILIFLMIMVGLITVAKNRFCSKRSHSRQPRPDSMDMVSIDQSKASTSSNGRPATIKFRKNPEKAEYQEVSFKPDVSSEARKSRTKKRDLEAHQSHSRKSSTGDSVTNREQFVSTSSLPEFDV